MSSALTHIGFGILNMFGVVKRFREHLLYRLIVSLFAIILVLAVASIILFRYSVREWNRRVNFRNNEVVLNRLKVAMLRYDKKFVMQPIYDLLFDNIVQPMKLEKRDFHACLKPFFKAYRIEMNFPESAVSKLVMVDKNGAILGRIFLEKNFRRRKFEIRFGGGHLPGDILKKLQNASQWSMVFIGQNMTPSGYNYFYGFRAGSFEPFFINGKNDIYFLVEVNLRRLLQTVQRTAGLRSMQGILIWDQNGTIIYHPDPRWQSQYIRKLLPQLPNVKSLHPFEQVAKTSTGNYYLLTVDSFEHKYYLTVFTNLESQEFTFVNKILAIHGIVFFFVFLLGAFLISLVLHNSLQSISELNQQVTSIVKGDWAEEIPVRRRDEIGELAVSFNRMLENLNRSIEELAEEKARKLHYEQISQFKSSLIRQFGHDLEKILNTIKVPVENLLLGIYGGIDDRQLRALHRIKIGADLMDSMTRDMMALSKIEAGKLMLNLDTFRADDLLEDIQPYVQAFQERFRWNHIHISIENLSHGVLITADREKMSRVLINLLSNAIDAVRRKKDGAEGTVVLRSFVEDHQIVWEVEDNGIGIPEGEQMRIFEPFYQYAGTNENGKMSGAGIGLPIVKAFVELHGGKISVRSQVQKGSIFRVEMILLKQTKST